MKAIGFLLASCFVVSASLMACSSAPASDSEEVNIDSEELTGTGYCQLTATDHTVTGYCLTGGSLCTSKLSSACVVGAPAIQATYYPAGCLPRWFDLQRRC